MIVNVCSKYVMYSFVRLKTPLDISLFTPTHIFLRDEWPFLGTLKRKESELFSQQYYIVKQTVSSFWMLVSVPVEAGGCTG